MILYHLIIIIVIMIIFFYYYNYNLYNREYFNTNNKIPKIIIQTWKDSNIPDRYKKLISSVKKYNPSYKYLFFTDNDIEVFLKKYYPNYYDTFVKLPITIQKIDFFRYVAIYHYGGFYLDLDIECTKPFDTLLDNDCVFGIDRHITMIHPISIQDKQQINQDVKRKFIVGQYAFGSQSKNEFIKILIDEIHNNINKILEEYNKLPDKKNLNFVYNTTGPNYVSDMYYTNYKDLPIKILYYHQNQNFGNYARHKFMGTWKN
jgi:hypothetical protein